MSDSGRQIGDCRHNRDQETCWECWRAEAGIFRERADKLQAFKDWTHGFLDAHGVPHHPPGTHGAAGCRIGDRMDWLMERHRQLQQYASYCRCCAQSGEHDPIDFDAFLAKSANEDTTHA